MAQWDVCPTCNGLGYEQCEICNGEMGEDCPDCGEWAGKPPCTMCDGGGQVEICFPEYDSEGYELEAE